VYFLDGYCSTVKGLLEFLFFLGRSRVPWACFIQNCHRAVFRIVTELTCVCIFTGAAAADNSGTKIQKVRPPRNLQCNITLVMPFEDSSEILKSQPAWDLTI